MSGQSGKGNSSAETKQEVQNNQVAASSGIAVGAGASGNSFNISSSDPGVTAAALQAGVQQSAIAAHTADSAFAGVVAGEGQALNFAGHAADVAAQTNILAQKSVSDIAGGSILAQNDLATKFGDKVSEIAGQNVSLLQSIAQENTTVSLKALDNSHDALGSAFGVAAQAAPQTDNYTATELASTSAKTYIYIAIAAGLALFGFFFFGRKRA